MNPEESQTQLNRYVEQQELLLNVTRNIARSVGLSETIPHILGGIDRALNADSVRLLLTGAGGRWQTFTIGDQAEETASADVSIVDLVAEHGEVEISPANQPDLLPPGLVSVIALPLTAHQTLHGVLWLGFQAAHTFDAAERTFLSILAGQAAIAIANARSFEAARKRREWLAAILASTPDPVLVVDREQCLQLVNPAAQEMFGISDDDAIGQQIEQVVSIPEILDLLQEDEQPNIMDYTAANGRTYSPSVSEIRTESGEMTGWVLVLRDISHFKRLNDNMSDFLSTVSHDMRSPLTFMKGYLDMLGMVGELNEKQNDFVYKIAVGVVQMSDMVEKILEAGKLDPMTGNYELLREQCDVFEVVQKAVAGLAEAAEKKSLAISYDIADGIPIVNVDKAMLSSAFTNLVENAVKYTPEGGKVRVSVSLNGNDLVFAVTDNGYGISLEDQEKLFERNVRIHRKEWKRVKGSGLGLFIVKNVAQRHGGDAWVQSQEGEGSSFFLAIPLAGENIIGSESIGTESAVAE
ncbi:MAG: PAS domain-containing protein [Chloroflexi bacterium]|nr:PAS domain-containing protein [Chloroflexota bacterium]